VNAVVDLIYAAPTIGENLVNAATSIAQAVEAGMASSDGAQGTDYQSFVDILRRYGASTEDPKDASATSPNFVVEPLSPVREVLLRYGTHLAECSRSQEESRCICGWSSIVEALNKPEADDTKSTDAPQATPESGLAGDSTE
jgi:hypothetical protein